MANIIIKDGKNRTYCKEVLEVVLLKEHAAVLLKDNRGNVVKILATVSNVDKVVNYIDHSLLNNEPIIFTIEITNGIKVITGIGLL